jgi:hypothetical protein
VRNKSLRAFRLLDGYGVWSFDGYRNCVFLGVFCQYLYLCAHNLDLSLITNLSLWLHDCHEDSEDGYDEEECTKANSAADGRNLF